jgi:thiamine-monophosphate kinase
MRPLLERHLMPEARKPGNIARHASSMIDVSDGLFIDLTRLCTESGDGARIYEDRIPVSDGMRVAADFLGKDPMGLATAGGEDYELLFTAPRGKRINAHLIGEVTGSGMVYIKESGVESQIKPEGYRHFG